MATSIIELAPLDLVKQTVIELGEPLAKLNGDVSTTRLVSRSNTTTTTTAFPEIDNPELSECYSWLKTWLDSVVVQTLWKSADRTRYTLGAICNLSPQLGLATRLACALHYYRDNTQPDYKRTHFGTVSLNHSWHRLNLDTTLDYTNDEDEHINYNRLVDFFHHNPIPDRYGSLKNYFSRNESVTSLTSIEELQLLASLYHWLVPAGVLSVNTGLISLQTVQSPPSPVVWSSVDDTDILRQSATLQNGVLQFLVKNSGTVARPARPAHPNSQPLALLNASAVDQLVTSTTMIGTGQTSDLNQPDFVGACGDLHRNDGNALLTDLVRSATKLAKTTGEAIHSVGRTRNGTGSAFYVTGQAPVQDESGELGHVVDQERSPLERNKLYTTFRKPPTPSLSNRLPIIGSPTHHRPAPVGRSTTITESEGRTNLINAAPLPDTPSIMPSLRSEFEKRRRSRSMQVNHTSSPSKASDGKLSNSPGVTTWASSSQCTRKSSQSHRLPDSSEQDQISSSKPDLAVTPKSSVAALRLSLDQRRRAIELGRQRALVATNKATTERHHAAFQKLLQTEQRRRAELIPKPIGTVDSEPMEPSSTSAFEPSSSCEMSQVDDEMLTQSEQQPMSHSFSPVRSPSLASIQMVTDVEEDFSAPASSPLPDDAQSPSVPEPVVTPRQETLPSDPKFNNPTDASEVRQRRSPSQSLNEASPPPLLNTNNQHSYNAPEATPLLQPISSNPAVSSELLSEDSSRSDPISSQDPVSKTSDSRTTFAEATGWVQPGVGMKRSASPHDCSQPNLFRIQQQHQRQGHQRSSPHDHHDVARSIHRHSPAPAHTFHRPSQNRRMGYEPSANPRRHPATVNNFSSYAPNRPHRRLRARHHAVDALTEEEHDRYDYDDDEEGSAVSEDLDTYGSCDTDEVGSLALPRSTRSNRDMEHSSERSYPVVHCSNAPRRHQTRSHRPRVQRNLSPSSVVSLPIRHTSDKDDANAAALAELNRKLSNLEAGLERLAKQGNSDSITTGDFNSMENYPLRGQVSTKLGRSNPSLTSGFTGTRARWDERAKMLDISLGYSQPNLAVDNHPVNNPAFVATLDSVVPPTALSQPSSASRPNPSQGPRSNHGQQDCTFFVDMSADSSHPRFHTGAIEERMETNDEAINGADESKLFFIPFGEPDPQRAQRKCDQMEARRAAERAMTAVQLEEKRTQRRMEQEAEDIAQQERQAISREKREAILQAHRNRKEIDQGASANNLYPVQSGAKTLSRSEVDLTSNLQGTRNTTRSQSFVSGRRGPVTSPRPVPTAAAVVPNVRSAGSTRQTRATPKSATRPVTSRPSAMRGSADGEAKDASDESDDTAVLEPVTRGSLGTRSPLATHRLRPTNARTLTSGYSSNRLSTAELSSPRSGSGIFSASQPKLFIKPKAKSNRMVIVNAIGHACLAGAVNEPMKQATLKELAATESTHFMILFRDLRCQYRAVYSFHLELEELHLICGTGPRKITHDMANRFFKYNSGGKHFTEITSTNHLSPVVDAITIHDSLWSKSGAQSAAALNLVSGRLL